MVFELNEVEFTYDFYKFMINLLKEHKYNFSFYNEFSNKKKCVILRHDIDNSIDKALQFAKLEKKEDVKSTYFILLSSPFYNIFNNENRQKLLEISSLGHDLGLHFDEMNYLGINQDIPTLVKEECQILQNWLSVPIKSVSMHRPSKKTLEANYSFDGVINSYGKIFFNDFKYVSDSRHHWREDVISIIKSEKFDKLQILTHAFWYNNIDLSMKDSIHDFFKDKIHQTYQDYKNNFTDLDSVIKEDEIW